MITAYQANKLLLAKHLMTAREELHQVVLVARWTEEERLVVQDLVKRVDDLFAKVIPNR